MNAEGHYGLRTVCVEERLLELELLVLRESVEVELDPLLGDGTPVGTEGNASNRSEPKRLDDSDAESGLGEEGDSCGVKSGRFRRGAEACDDSVRLLSVDFFVRETVLAREGLRWVLSERIYRWHTRQNQHK